MAGDWGMIFRKTKMFGTEVKRVWKSDQPRDEMVKDENFQILRDGVEVRRKLQSILSSY